MDTKDMKSSIIVVLLALLIGIVGQATATVPSSYTCYDPEPSEKITIDKLLSVLGSTFDTDDYMIFGSNAERVFWELESTKEKGRADAILKQYSVQQLLDFNTYTVADCTDEAFKQRSQKCKSFCSRDQAGDINPPASLIKVNRKEAFIKHNLGVYCWAIVKNMQRMCPYRQLQNAINEDDVDRLWALFSKARRIDLHNMVRTLNIEGTKKRLTKHLAKEGPIESYKFWNHCSKVVEILDAPRSYDFPISGEWYQFVQFCRLFTEGFEETGHNKDDLKKAEIN